MGNRFILILFSSVAAAASLAAAPVLCGGPRLVRPEGLEACAPPESPDLVDLNRRAREFYTAGKYPQARALVEEAERLGGQSPARAAILTTLGEIDREQLRYTAAESRLREASALLHDAAAADQAAAWNNLAQVLQAEGKWKDAEALLLHALDTCQQVFGPADSHVAVARQNLGVFYQDRRRYADAERMYRLALSIDTAASGPDSSAVARDLSGLGSLALELRHYADAESALTRSVAITRARSGAINPAHAMTLVNLATTYWDEKRPELAAPLFQEACAIFEAAYGPKDPRVGRILSEYVTVLRAVHEYSEAERVQVRATAAELRHLPRSRNSFTDGQ